MMTNRYKGRCSECGAYVPARRGKCFKPAGARRYSVLCASCAAEPASPPPGRPDLVSERCHVAYFPSTGQYLYQNKAGRCEDAPCCGCCTY
jgi:hypothetical protein